MSQVGRGQHGFAALLKAVRPAIAPAIRPAVPYADGLTTEWVGNFLSESLPVAISFTRASSATYIDANSVMQAVGTDVPRFDLPYGLTGPKGLMVEGNRTNLLLNSASLSTQSVSVTAQAYTLSFYGTGTITLSGAKVGSLVGTGAFPSRAALAFTPTAGTLTLTVSGSVQYAQLEAGGFASSYIPTTAASATRAAEYPLISDVNQIGFNPAEGTWFLDTYSSPDTSGIQLGFSVDNGQIVRGHMNVNPSQTVLFFFSSQGNMVVNAAGVAAGTRVRMAGSYSFGVGGGACSVSVNGALVGSASNAAMTTPPAFNYILPGYRRSGSVGQQWCYVPISRLTYTPKKLSDSQLVAMTA